MSLNKIITEIRQVRISEFKQIEGEKEKFFNHLITVGVVGYPNVGKSSVINTLCNKKLVGVGAKPGKTKNIQTLYLENDLMLCDCPGLVFPNAASTRGELVCNGVLPIDKIKDYLTPMDLLAERIPKVVFNQLYSISLDKVKKMTGTEVLTIFG